MAIPFGVSFFVKTVERFLGESSGIELEPSCSSWRTASLWLASHERARGRGPTALGDTDMEFFRVYGRVIGLLRDERGLAIMLAFANVAVAALQFYEPVLFGKVVDLLSNAKDQINRRALARRAAAAGAVGRRRPGRHRRQHRRLAAGRPHGAPPAAGRHGELLRARAGAAVLVPQLPAFRPAAQGHADRRRRSVRHLALVLPREPRDLRGAVHHAAAQPVHELAAGRRC